MSATNVIKGVVDSTRTKTVNTRRGDAAIYYGTVDGIEFSTGFTKRYSEGEMISIGVEYKYNEWQYQDGSTGAGLPDASTNVQSFPAGGKAPASGGKGAGGFPIDPLNGQISIIRQNSMNRSVEIMAQWADTGLFTPSDEPTYLKKLIEVALIITDFNSGQDIMKLKAVQAASLAAVVDAAA